MIGKKSFKHQINFKENPQGILHKHPSFLEDQNQKPTRLIQQKSELYKTNSDNKTFDLEKLKQQLGLIELRNSIKNEEELSIIDFTSKLDGPLLKKQKSQQSNLLNKKEINLQRTNPTQQDNSSGKFTQRIQQLVRMRYEHQKIIGSLIGEHKKKSSKPNQKTISMIKRVSSIDLTSDQKNQQVKHNCKRNDSRRSPDQQVEIQIMLDKKNSTRSTKKMQKSDFSSYDQTPPHNSQQMYLPNEAKTVNHNIKCSASQVRNSRQSGIETVRQSQIELQYSPNQKLEISQNMEIHETSPVQINQFQEPQSFGLDEHVNLASSLSQFEHLSVAEVKPNLSLENQLSWIVSKYVLERLYESKLRQEFKHLDCFNVQVKYLNSQNSNQLKEFKKNINRMHFSNSDFKQTLLYIVQSQIMQGLITQESRKYFTNTGQQLNIPQFHGLFFDSGNYIESIISLSQLTLEQQKFIFLDPKIQNGSLKVDITLILLSRLINLIVHSSFPQMLNKLFGYQFKVFDIKQVGGVMDFVEFVDRLRDIHLKQIMNENGQEHSSNEKSFKDKYSCRDQQQNEQPQSDNSIRLPEDKQKHCNFHLYGYNKTLRTFQAINSSVFIPSKTSSILQLYEFRQLIRNERHLKKLSQTYSGIAIINEKQLPVKSINLKHFENHFVVVSLTVAEQGLAFLGVGQKLQHHSLKNYNCTKYRICLISSTSKTILECVILSQNESYPVYLPKEEFQVYISAFSQSNGQQIEKSNLKRQMFVFTFYVQSQHIKAKHDFMNLETMQNQQLQFQLRLKEDYKNYTSMIIEQFIKFSFLDKEINKFFTDLDCYQEVSQNQNDVNNFQTAQIKGECQVLPLEYNHQVNSASFKNQLSTIHQSSTFQNNCSMKSKGKHIKQDAEREVLTLEQLLFEKKTHQIIILRVHLKALNLYIDCIDTSFFTKKMEQKISEEQMQEFNTGLTIQYTEQRVLCDTNYQKNKVFLRLDTINLIYLTKNSSIKRIWLPSSLQKQNSQQKFQWKVYEKEW